MKLEEKTINISATGAESNTVMPTRNVDNYVPEDVSIREVVEVYISDDSGGSNTVTIENYDNEDSEVDNSVKLNVAADEDDKTDAGKVLEVPREDSDGNSHSVTYSCDGAFTGVIRIRDIV